MSRTLQTMLVMKNALIDMSAALDWMIKEEKRRMANMKIRSGGFVMEEAK